MVISIISDAVFGFLDSGDHRVNDWPLVYSPLPTLGLCLTYVTIVKVIGPKIMKDRNPFEIRWLMVVYNFLMVIVSSYLFWILGIHGWFGKYNYCCQPVDYSDSPDAIGMATAAYWYYITKFVEFFDTVFFVLRKKNDHITKLHVIHHGIMPMSVWWGVKFTPGGHSTFFAFINSGVHILMYIYYGMAAIGPHMSKYLFWKKHMTSIQMVQFIAIFGHSFQLLFRSCDYPRGFMWWIGFHAVLFWFLFWDFYVNTYLPRAKGPWKQQVKLSKFLCNGETAAFLKNEAHDRAEDEASSNLKSNNQASGDSSSMSVSQRNNKNTNGYRKHVHQNIDSDDGNKDL